MCFWFWSLSEFFTTSPQLLRVNNKLASTKRMHNIIVKYLRYERQCICAK
jgi:hypothetical protein